MAPAGLGALATVLAGPAAREMARASLVALVTALAGLEAPVSPVVLATAARDGAISPRKWFA